jgi:deoxyribose-phosphate aldolase
MKIAARIDHTLLKAEGTSDQVAKLCAEALEHGFASVCVNGAFVGHVAGLLHKPGSVVKACAVAGFPLGAMTASSKAAEAAELVKLGADEIDFVAFLPDLLAQDVKAATEAFASVVKAAKGVNPRVLVKVILETSALMHEAAPALAEARVAAGCQAAIAAGCDFVKTSTGFHPTGGATVESVRLLRKHAGKLQVKASGGIRSYDDAQRMVDAGADRLGCSAGVQIVRGMPVGGSGY